jgi:membrane protein DedA with SNARE-associated domain
LVHGLFHTYGLWVLFALVMLESMGIPLPGETALVTAALYAGSTHQIGIAWVVLVAALAAILGDNIGYLIGRSIGIRLVARYGRYVRLDEPRLKVGQYLFLRHGGKIVFFGRFVAFLRAYAALLAGVNRMSWPHFLLMNALGGICWAALFGGGAYLFGAQVKRVTGPVGFVSFFCESGRATRVCYLTHVTHRIPVAGRAPRGSGQPLLPPRPHPDHRLPFRHPEPHGDRHAGRRRGHDPRSPSKAERATDRVQRTGD